MFADLDEFYFGGALPGGASRSKTAAKQFAVATYPSAGVNAGLGAGLTDTSVGLERWQRAVLPGWAEDFAVGLNRVALGQVGKNGNPTLKEAYRSTDKTFGGWLPGAEKPNLPNPLEDLMDLGKWLIIGGAVVGVALLAGRDE